MARINTNSLLHPTKRIIENWKGDFRTSDGPNNSTFISLSDLGIPYDSHYRSRIVLPSNETDYLLHYGLKSGVTFLLIKVTYNGDYDKEMEDSYDPLYYYEPNTYNINYYYEGNSGTTFPIGRLLILNGSLTNKLPRIYLNNPLDYNVVLDVLHADISEPIPQPISSAITISNLYYSDVITNQVTCSYIYTGITTTTTTLPITTTTTTTTISGSTTTTTTTILKEMMKIIKTNIDGVIRYSSSGETMGLFDYVYVDQWFYAGEESNFLDFTNTEGILRIRFYFVLNNKFDGILKTEFIYPLDHNNGLYFVDVNADGIPIPPISGTTSGTSGSSGSSGSSGTSGSSGSSGIYSGSTEFIIYEYKPNITGYTIFEYNIPYNIILSIQKNVANKSIYVSTTSIYYTLKFLTEFDCNQAYSRMMFAYASYSNNTCRYLTPDNSYENGNVIICTI